MPRVFIPITKPATRYQDLLWIPLEAQQHVAWWIRADFAKRLDSSICVDDDECTYCGAQAMARHHQMPVWAGALRYILDLNPQSIIDTFRIARGAEGRKFAVVNCLANILPLCHNCHSRANSKAYHRWKKFFIDSYDAIFGHPFCSIDGKLVNRCGDR